MGIKREEVEEIFVSQPPLFDIAEEELEFSGKIDPLEAKLAADNSKKALEERLRKLPAVMTDENGIAKPRITWGALYFTLIDLGWNWRVATYMSWAASKKIGRVPETIEELATDYLGLTSRRAISKWRAKNPEIDKKIGVLQSAMVFDYIPDAIEAMGISASQPTKEGNRDRKLMFEMTGHWQPSMRIKDERSVPDNDLAGLSAEDLKKKRDALAKSVSEESENG